MESDRGYETHRETCPHLQTWLRLKGKWTERRSSHVVHCGPGSFSRYMPFEPAKRIAEERTVSLGLRIFSSTKGVEDSAHWLLWKVVAAEAKGLFDPHSFDELILQTQRSSRPETGETSWLRRAKNLIEEGQFESVIQLAETIEISPNYLSASFRRVYGVTIAQFRRRVWLHRSLVKADGNFDPGFYDVSHFHRTCRAELGISPPKLAEFLRGL